MQGVRQCCDGVKCFREFCSTDLNSCLQRYAQDVENPDYKEMVEAIFECFEALLNYKGKLEHLVAAYNKILYLSHTHMHMQRWPEEY